MPEPSASFPAIYQLRVVLRGVSPLVWRRLLVASDTRLAELHATLQHAFAWSDEHLHRFLIHGTAYGAPRLSGIAFRDDARRVPLSRFRLHRGERFRYEYDFTADWNLDLRLERVLPLDPKRALPPAPAEAGRRRPEAARGPGLICSNWMSTKAACPSKSWCRWRKLPGRSGVHGCSERQSSPRT